MVIWELSAARELSIGIPIERRIATPKNKSIKHQVLFILTSYGCICERPVPNAPYLLKGGYHSIPLRISHQLFMKAFAIQALVPLPYGCGSERRMIPNRSAKDWLRTIYTPKSGLRFGAFE